MRVFKLQIFVEMLCANLPEASMEPPCWWSSLLQNMAAGPFLTYFIGPMLRHMFESSLKLSLLMTTYTEAI